MPPSRVSERLADLPIAQLEQREEQVLNGAKKTALDRFFMRYFQYARIANPPDCLGFLRYLQYLWGAEHLWQVPLQAASRGVKRTLQR